MFSWIMLDPSACSRASLSSLPCALECYGRCMFIDQTPILYADSSQSYNVMNHVNLLTHGGLHFVPHVCCEPNCSINCSKGHQPVLFPKRYKNGISTFAQEKYMEHLALGMISHTQMLHVWYIHQHLPEQNHPTFALKITQFCSQIYLISVYLSISILSMFIYI